MNDREMIESITADKVREYMEDTWIRYCSSSRLGLRLDFNGTGKFRVIKEGQTLWKGTDLDEAIAQLKNAV